MGPCTWSAHRMDRRPDRRTWLLRCVDGSRACDRECDMTDAFADVSWLGVLAGGFAYYVLGGIWYADPVLGRRYYRALGFTPPAGFKPTTAMYVGPLVGC